MQEFCAVCFHCDLPEANWVSVVISVFMAMNKAAVGKHFDSLVFFLRRFEKAVQDDDQL